MLRIIAETAKEALEGTVNNKLPQNPLNLQAILNWVYAILGIVAVIGIIFGAVVWTTSQGDPDKIKKGRNAVLYAVIGLVIVVLATAITNFVISSGSNGQ